MNKQKKAMCNYIHDRINKVLPYLYSAIAVAFWNKLDMPDEEKADAICTLIAESQRVWEESTEKGIDITKWCEDLTGIDVAGGVNEVR